jgi:nucleoside-diphosphate-sugar epimerase
VVREFMDVRDVADVYAALLESAAASQAVNLCAGRGYRLDEILEKLRALTGAAPRIERAPALVRSNEIPQLVGSPARLKSLVPSVAFRPLDDTLRWMLAGV